MCEPGTGAIRYVGKSDTPLKRFKRHQSDKKKCHRTNWIKGLQTRGLSPILEILDTVPIVEWQFWEREYIKVFRATGMNLVNGTDGGEGVVMYGKDHPNFGKPLPEWQKQAIRNARLGKPLSEALKEKLRRVLRVTNTSGTPGVCYNKKARKWIAKLARNGKQPFIGQFSTLEEAVAARQAALSEDPTPALKSSTV